MSHSMIEIGRLSHGLRIEREDRSRKEVVHA